MPPFYDIYGLSRQRDKENVEKFLNHFCYRDRVESRKGQEILVYNNPKYGVQEVIIQISTLTEVIDYAIKQKHHGFVFYIGDNLKHGIKDIILKFTFDDKVIFGISVEEKIINENGDLIDNYPKAIELVEIIVELTGAIKTFIQVEYAPPDDEEEFDNDIEVWRNLNEENVKKKSGKSFLRRLWNGF